MGWNPVKSFTNFVKAPVKEIKHGALGQYVGRGLAFGQSGGLVSNAFHFGSEASASLSAGGTDLVAQPLLVNDQEAKARLKAFAKGKETLNRRRLAATLQTSGTGVDGPQGGPTPLGNALPQLGGSLQRVLGTGNIF